MRCFLHHEHDAVAICPACGRGLCAACARPVGLACACEDCVDDAATLAARQPTPQTLTQTRRNPLQMCVIYFAMGVFFAWWIGLLGGITHDFGWLKTLWLAMMPLTMSLTGFVLYGVLRCRQRRRR